MKVIKFIFKFVNHNTEQTLIIHVDTYCEHLFKETDLEKSLKYLEMAKQKHELKNLVEAKVREMHFGSAVEFIGYDLCKVKKMVESEKVNLNFGKKGGKVGKVETKVEKVKLRKIHFMIKCIMKFSQGVKTVPWTKVFDYTKNHHFHAFHVKKDGGKLMLESLGSFDIPMPPASIGGNEDNETQFVNSENQLIQKINDLKSRLSMPDIKKQFDHVSKMGIESILTVGSQLQGQFEKEIDTLKNAIPEAELKQKLQDVAEMVKQLRKDKPPHLQVKAKLVGPVLSREQEVQYNKLREQLQEKYESIRAELTPSPELQTRLNNILSKGIHTMEVTPPNIPDWFDEEIRRIKSRANPKIQQTIQEMAQLVKEIRKIHPMNYVVADQPIKSQKGGLHYNKYIKYKTKYLAKKYK